MIKLGDIVEILPEFRDHGDDSYRWIALGDEEKGRVDIQPIDHPLRIKPTYTLKSVQLRVVPPDPGARS